MNVIYHIIYHIQTNLEMESNGNRTQANFFYHSIKKTHSWLSVISCLISSFLKERKIKHNRENNIVTVVEFIIQYKLLSADK